MTGCMDAVADTTAGIQAERVFERTARERLGGCATWPIWRVAGDLALHSWYLEAFECLDGAAHRLVRMVLQNLAKGLTRLGLQD